MRLILKRTWRFLLVTTLALFVILNISVLYDNFYINRLNQSAQSYELETLKREIARINRDQHIHNLDKFALNLSSQSLVFVIQVHDRHPYLDILLESMRRVRGINETLIIVSHDFYSDTLNQIVQSVDFCPVMQIFYPFSQQVYAHQFPGEDPNDCPRDLNRDQARKIKCNNAEHPDKYGHYREAKYCQAKHHWMWKLSHVFQAVRVLQGYQGLVMLLEEDYFLAEDLVWSTLRLKELRDRECPECKMLVMGNYEKNQNYFINGHKVEKSYWVSSRHNMGMAFNISLWRHIQKCAEVYCQFDDYNWDWTLQHLSMTCIPDKVKLLVMKATRVFHIGECGMHQKSKVCDPIAKSRVAETKLHENQHNLFPEFLSLAGESRFKLLDPKPNGGWGDSRDHTLCQMYFNTTNGITPSASSF